MRLSHLFAIGLVVAACAPEAEDNDEGGMMPLSQAAIDSVRAVDAAFAAGMNAGDSAAVVAVYAADAHLMPPDSPALQGDGIGAVIGSLIRGGASNMTLNTTYTYGIGDLAYSIGTATFTMGGAEETVKYTEVLRRGEDGKWRYVVDMFSGVAPAAAKE